MLTKLQAINQILTGVGETAVLTRVEGATDQVNAETIIDAETKKVLAKGWHVNTDDAVVLYPDTDGHIAVPLDSLRSDPVDTRKDLVPRGGFFWDRARNSDVFTGPVTFKVIRLLDFEDLPYDLQNLIVARAAMKYQRSYVGSKQLDDQAQQELAEAVAVNDDAEFDLDNFNMLNNPDVADALHFNARTPRL